MALPRRSWKNRMLVSVSGYHPGYHPRYEGRVVRKRGKRTAKEVIVAVQETIAWFGLFGGSEGDGHKGNAQH
jgi:hypothetical protein